MIQPVWKAPPIALTHSEKMWPAATMETFSALPSRLDFAKLDPVLINQLSIWVTHITTIRCLRLYSQAVMTKLLQMPYARGSQIVTLHHPVHLCVISPSDWTTRFPSPKDYSEQVHVALSASDTGSSRRQGWRLSVCSTVSRLTWMMWWTKMDG